MDEEEAPAEEEPPAKQAGHAPGSYMLFCKAKRPEILKKHPGIAFREARPRPRAHACSTRPPHGPCVPHLHAPASSACDMQVGKKLGAAWKKLSDAEKAKYAATAAKGAAKNACTWAQCERCAKWRRLQVREEDLPEQWWCELNEDVRGGARTK